ncbi:Alpha-(1,6)-fucosyltransferase [Hypsibius exemplaris]|uniref:Alpha-(1,6)-fucosyltransferase n=1 Tax=Hypsibius exemplaris TaxID=2072580 RepID=A0A1W0WIK6_HYPEX|nr:Alpha-(1,6)-fucosyltransferase [Hypsibius exemplaris]
MAGMVANYTQLKRFVAVGVALWFLMLFGLSRMFLSSESDSEHVGKSLEQVLGRIATAGEKQQFKTAMDKIEKLQQQNDILQRRLQDLRNPALQRPVAEIGHAAADGGEYLVPSKEFEYSRRKLENGIVEFWRYASTHLKDLYETKDSNAAKALAKQMLDFMGEHKGVILADINNLESAAGITEWKLQKSLEMTRIVQNRLKNLQNPRNCAEARRLRCSINKACGLGCQLHHATYCLIAGYALNRTVILESKGWRYSKKGWESVFLPLTKTCKSSDIGTPRAWRDDPENDKEPVIELPIVDNIQGASGNNKRPLWLPLAVPRDLFTRIHAFHKNPPIWWMGQIVSYLWRLQPSTQKILNELTTKMVFASPIVGVHVRRTDKVGTEAAKHEVSEYMEHVKAYFDQLDVTKKTAVRRVYVATDDSAAFHEIKKNYPDYEILGNTDSMDSAALNKRYSDASLIGVITDVHFLSQSDHLVCTFSSQVCRLAYELMQARLPDAADFYNSLDDVYYYGGQNGHNVRAILPHQAANPEEISFDKGDLLGLAGNHWDGYSVAQHKVTDRKGKFPSYKAEEHFVKYDMPHYEDRSDL